jgi:hypothetical protein
MSLNFKQDFTVYMQVPSIQYTDSVKCSAVLAGDVTELAKAEQVLKSRPKVPIYEETYLEWTKDCQQFRKHRGYVEVIVNTTGPALSTSSAFSDTHMVHSCVVLCFSPAAWWGWVRGSLQHKKGFVE